MISVRSTGNPCVKGASPKNSSATSASLLLLLALILAAFHQPAIAQEKEREATGTDEKPRLVAVVGDESIWARQIEWEFNKKFSNRVMDEAVANRLRHQIFLRLIKQHIILDKFRNTAVFAKDDEVNLKISQLEERLKQIDKKLEDYLKENGTKLDDLKFNLRWQISWKRYIDKTLSDKVLENYYGRSPYRFDGTRLKVSHLLLKTPTATSDPKSEVDRAKQLKSAREKLTAIRAQIESGEITWQAAVAQHSQGSTADQFGSIGDIGIDGPMPVPFTEAAFQLKQAEISPVVATPFGVHLIRCDEIILGHRNWYDCKKELRRAATEELFERVEKKHRPKVSVQIVEDSSSK